MTEHGSGELLHEPDEMYRALRSLQLTRSLVTLRFKGDSATYSSMILLCELDTRQFIIDELRPETGNAKLAQGTPFTLTGFYEGIQVLCKGDKIKSGNIPGLSNAYALPFPAYVYRKQRRDSYRTHIPSSVSSLIKLSSEQRNNQISGVVADISTSGIGCEFEGYVRPEFQPGEIIEEAEIHISDDFSLSTSLKVKHPYYNKGSNKTHCGFEFYDLSKINQKQVDKQIATIQRNTRRELNKRYRAPEETL